MKNRRFSLTTIVLIPVLAVAIATLPTVAQSQQSPDPEIVVIGEVQGAANTVTALLKHLDLIDADQHWTGGNTTLVQTGDLIDDGENVRAVLDLFMRLQEEAAAAGGQVIVLMGNHEAMNILGELRCVNYMAFQSFAGPESEKLQRQAWEEWLAWRSRRAKALGERFDAEGESETEWFAAHPPGWVEYADSMGPEGVYGTWLRSLPVAVEIDNALFVHAGISPDFEDRNVASINRRAADEIKKFDEYREFMVARGICLRTSSISELADIISDESDHLASLSAAMRKTARHRQADVRKVLELGHAGLWSVLDKNGPLWFRGTAKGPEEELGPKMASILEAFEVDRIVTGQSGGRERLIGTRFDNRVLLTSIDMSDDPYIRGGDPAALEIEDGDYFVVTLKGRELLIDN